MDAKGSSQDSTKSECPICVMMREGGCEKQFHAFMDCGVEAEAGKREYSDCVKMFDAMRTCMQQNPAAFGELLKDVDDATGQTGQQKAENPTDS
mmetsp:Transcript_8991/g.19299  ORF Transcript_8991/g.19299 Transcript_8991/m.19299 type:complete len:94 (+) Transcript_8991:221-502(+)|eukprot:CAMPEP_0202914616 /NCGR_PEP_ID=MMETSP1392-20130828/63550_1 /ASSEMBLY_ACC=CAM_ASM_000868 /TAXON_ID=225041 /ORGANISM="Chlamydomonas chlamydogama, Strain SAG 11-48b" /LENGTH=93 /DNA_ID=CAMNT_0049606327 /DNA_START=193 /DNA_END=474 /DNA_ORIENTATION=-